MSTKARRETKFTRFIKAPIRVLTRARDFYVDSMSDCAGSVSYGSVNSYVIGCPTYQISTLPRSFSSNSRYSNDEDFQQLIRAASTRNQGKKIDQLELLRQKKLKQIKVVRRSQSVVIGRIDEDKPCEYFGEDVKVKMDMFPRSRSQSVSKLRGMV